MNKGKTIAELNVGDIHTKEMKLTEKEVQSFAAASGDTNPIHLNEEYAAQSVFKKRVVHGVLLLGVVSGVLGIEFPGIGTIAREINSRFARPVYVNDTIKVEVKIKELNTKYNLCKVSYKVFNGEGKVAVKGTAAVLPPT